MDITSGLKRARIEDDEHPMDNGLDVQSKMMSSIGKKLGQETPITIPPTISLIPWTATHTIYMPCDYSFLIKTLNPGLFRAVFIRPTSIYDPAYGLTTNTYAATAAGGCSYQTGGTSANTLNFGFNSSSGQPIPGWRPYFEQLYTKYCVLKCDYNITCVTTDETRGQDYWCFLTNIGDNTSHPLSITEDYLNYNKTRKQILTTNRNSAEGAASLVEFKGTYYPGDFGEDLITDALAERWTTCAVGGAGSNPAYGELMELRVEPKMGTTQTAAGADILVNVSLMYTVQFKGLNQIFAFPTFTYTQWNGTYPRMYGKYP